MRKLAFANDMQIKLAVAKFSSMIKITINSTKNNQIISPER